jgi:dolichol-phosphate mannosyltransferase
LADDAVVVAVMPSHNDVPEPGLLERVREHVSRVVLVDDGSDEHVARRLDALAAEFELELVRLPERSGKGSAVRAGADQAGDADAVLVIDADGQHPAEAIPAFIAAARDAELVIGDRFSDLEQMPVPRRLANRATRRAFRLVTGREVRDTQNGMRLLRGRALETLPTGGYEAETAHLRRVLREGRAVAWVAIPAIYGTERSSFRAGRDGARVLWALVRPLERGARPQLRRQLPARFRPARPARNARPGTRARALPPQLVPAAAS